MVEKPRSLGGLATILEEFIWLSDALYRVKFVLLQALLDVAAILVEGLARILRINEHLLFVNVFEDGEVLMVQQLREDCQAEEFTILVLLSLDLGFPDRFVRILADRFGRAGQLDMEHLLLVIGRCVGKGPALPRAIGFLGLTLLLLLRRHDLWRLQVLLSFLNRCLIVSNTRVKGDEHLSVLTEISADRGALGAN